MGAVWKSDTELKAFVNTTLETHCSKFLGKIIPEDDLAIKQFVLCGRTVKKMNSELIRGHSSSEEARKLSLKCSPLP